MYALPAVKVKVIPWTGYWRKYALAMKDVFVEPSICRLLGSTSQLNHARAWLASSNCSELVTTIVLVVSITPSPSPTANSQSYSRYVANPLTPENLYHDDDTGIFY